MGKCSSCGEWNTLVEVISQTVDAIASRGSKLTPKSVKNIVNARPAHRISTGQSDVDEVLGGGIVLGSLLLVAGQPGIGKSTLLMQIAYAASKKSSVLYVSGEESVEQVALRAERLGALHDTLQLVSSNSADDIAATIADGKYDLVVVDSIQTVTVGAVASAAGTVSQITNATYMFMNAAKATGTAIIVVGHVTKEGSIAGPKTLEHMVDVVLQLEGDRYGGFKVLRGVKNRFGSTNESAIFEMKENGLIAIENPSASLLEERQASDGSVVLATMEGSRPLLVEVQALVNTTSYGYPKRTASGVDSNRVNLLIAMLEKRTKLQLADKDVYINIVGGLKIVEPAADLAICMAIASAAKGMQLKEDAVVFGELGLSGEIRRVPHTEKRLAEAKKMGFAKAIIPKQTNTQANSGVVQVKDIRTALNQFLVKD